MHKFYVNSKLCADKEMPHLTKRNEVSLAKIFRRKFFDRYIVKHFISSLG